MRPRVDYGADEAPPDALWLKVIRSPHASASFRYGDLDAFVERFGLYGTVTAQDIPNNRKNICKIFHFQSPFFFSVVSVAKRLLQEVK